jgi:uncharacterized protein (TIGR03435 family)
VYLLTVEKGGLKMQLSKEGSCTPYSMESPPPLPAPNAPRSTYCGFPRLTGDGLNWTLDGPGVSIGKLASTLSRSGLDRPVVDKTGLVGAFDLHLRWTADVPEDAAKSGTIADSTGLSIFTALKEQLGLKLESSKAQLRFLLSITSSSLPRIEAHPGSSQGPPPHFALSQIRRAFASKDKLVYMSPDPD